MKNNTRTRALFLISIFGLFPLCLFGTGYRSEDSASDKNTKFVMGGLLEPGDGSAFHPYNSLALAEADTEWDELVVLSSPVALDGGITMRSGTRLIGEKNPFDSVAVINQPRITNSSAKLNGGNGVVVNGDNVEIFDIYFFDTWASAIRCDNVNKLSIHNVLINGHNKGAVLDSIKVSEHPFSFNAYEVAAIHAQSNKKGIISVEHTTVSNNYNGSAILDTAYGQGKRYLIIHNCTFKGLKSGSDKNTVAIKAAAFEQNTEQVVDIKQCDFCDFLPITNGSYDSNAIELSAINGAKQNIEVGESNFINLLDQASQASTLDLGSNEACAILLRSITMQNAVLPDVKSLQKATIQHCKFGAALYRRDIRQGKENRAIQNETRSAISKLKIIDNYFNDIRDGIICVVDGETQDEHVILHNDATVKNAFYSIRSENHESIYGSSNLNTKIKFNDNLCKGGEGFSAFVVIPSCNASAGTDAPWNSLSVTVKNNCFNGGGKGFAGLIGIDFGTSGAGNAIIKAKNNGIVGFAYEIVDLFANINYQAKENWWGQPSGPSNVFNGGTGAVTIRNSLSDAPSKFQHELMMPNQNPCSIPVQLSDDKAREAKIKELKHGIKTGLSNIGPFYETCD